MLKIKLLIRLVVVFTAFGICVIPSSAQTSAAVYNNMGRLNGTVSISNHPTLGRTPANFFYIVFRRIGCSKCLIGTKTDIDGKYELFLGEGRYEILVFHPSPPAYDMLDPNQLRTIKVRPGIFETKFNIDLKLQIK